MLAVERSLSPRVTRECYCVSKAPGTYHIFRIVLKKQEVPSGLPLIYGLCHVPCVGGFAFLVPTRTSNIPTACSVLPPSPTPLYVAHWFPPPMEPNIVLILVWHLNATQPIRPTPITKPLESLSVQARWFLPSECQHHSWPKFCLTSYIITGVIFMMLTQCLLAKKVKKARRSNSNYITYWFLYPWYVLSASYHISLHDTP